MNKFTSFFRRSLLLLAVACCASPVVADDAPEGVVYPSYKGLVMAGYQAWFATPGDSRPAGYNGGYVHYQNGQTNNQGFRPGSTTIEYWPDMTEYTKTYDTEFKYPDGTTATVFSSADPETIDLHFKWMRDYNIDGAVVQRFKSAVEATQSGNTSSREIIGRIVEAARKYNRAFFIEYDLSGFSKESDITNITRDWADLCRRYGLNDPNRCPTYVWQDGKPMVGFYGVGLKKVADTNNVSADMWLRLFDGLVGRDGDEGEVSVFAGTAYYWYHPDVTNSDATAFENYEPVYKRLAVISPWSPGRYSSMTAFDGDKLPLAIEDLKWCQDNGVLYAPIAFPGFSWANMRTIFTRNADNSVTAALDPNNPYDACSREKGSFFWRQLYQYVNAGADGLFIAMFDEMDEGTCIFKCANTSNVPINTSSFNSVGKFLGYDDSLPTDWYLLLTGCAKSFLNNDGYANFTKRRPSEEVARDAVEKAVASGISGVTADSATPRNGKIYNLQGQQVETSATMLSRGIYIQDGKKFVVR